MTCVRLSKENLFSSNNAPEFNAPQLLTTSKVLISSQSIESSTFLFEINSEDICISKLVSQLKLLPSLFELEDNDTLL